MTASRESTTYDPAAELSARWPEWRVVHAPIRSGEVWIHKEQMVLLPPPADLDEERRQLAHVCAHLALEHEGRGWMSAEQEEQARWLAGLWLDELRPEA